MAVQWEWQGERFVARVSGVFDSEQSVKLAHLYFEDPRVEQTRAILFDCSECERFEFSMGEMAQMSALEFGGSRGLPRTRIAFVGGGPEIQAFYERYTQFYEMVYESADAQWEIEMFDELAAAERWLDEAEMKEES